MKLRKDFKEKWVAALRSGKYKQGKENLYNPMNNSFCCLGVAAHAVCGVPLYKLELEGFLSSNTNTKAKKIPQIIQGDEGIPSKLAHMNDKENRRFKTIANWIEKNL